MQVDEYQLFPTKLISIAFPDVKGLNDQLYHFFSTHETFQKDDLAKTADLSNLLSLAESHPFLEHLRQMFLLGAEKWLRSEKVLGEYTATLFMFPNFSRPREFVPAHNHDAHLAGIYYVRTTDGRTDAPRGPRLSDDPSDYWAQDQGVLILHDPRFNASLMSLTSDHYAKFFPRPGDMLIFPGYLWHSVTPHLQDHRRLAISINMIIEPRGQAAGYQRPLVVKASEKGAG